MPRVVHRHARRRARRPCPEPVAPDRRAIGRIEPGSWRPVVVGFFVYVASVLAAHFTRAPGLLSQGAVAMVAIAMVGNHQRLFSFRFGPPARCALLVIVPPVLGYLLNRDASFEAHVKFVLVFVVFLCVYSWRLAPVNRSRWRWSFLAGCIALILFSFLSGNYFEGDGGTRLSGVFENPNNLALMGMALPFFVNTDDPPRRQILIHGMAAATIAMTGTVGAILGYAVGLVFRLPRMLASWRSAAALVVVVCVAAAVLGSSSTTEHRVVRQFEAIQDSLSAVKSDGVDYGALVKVYGEGATSGAWRLTMWLAVLRAYGRGTAYEWIMGQGLGASVALFGNVPHNDFLRLLLETGALGLGAFIGLCWFAWRGMRREDRYVIPMVLTYCISENNFDNFLFMAMFMFYLASTQRPAPVRTVEPGTVLQAKVWMGPQPSQS